MHRMLIATASCCLLAMTSCKVTKPGPVESKVATEIKQKITIGGKGVPNPLQATDANIKEGQEHFTHHCAVCHGLDGEATGVPFASHMSPPVPSLSGRDIQDYEDGQLKWIIENGINPSGMPAWKGILQDDEMWKVVTFLRHLPPKGSLGIPRMYAESEEKHQHKREHTETPTGQPGQQREHQHSHPH